MGAAYKSSYLDSCTSPGCCIIGTSVLSHTEGPIGIDLSGVSVGSECHPVIDPRSSRRSSNVIGIAVWLRNMVFESQIHAMNFDV